MTGWTPLFQQIIASSIWNAPMHIRLAWVTMLAICNREGVAPVTASGLSRLANISLEQATEALQVLSSPDDDTLTQENEGRRIVRCETGWRILTWQKYREMAKTAMIREQNREAQARWRVKAEAEAEVGGESKDVNKCPPLSNQVKAELKPAGFVKPDGEGIALQCAKIGLPREEGQRFFDYYESNGWRVGKNPMRSWTAALSNWKRNYEQNKHETNQRPGKQPVKLDHKNAGWGEPLTWSGDTAPSKHVP